MRVLFSSTRGVGHVQPLLPFAQALKARGHDVRVASPSDLTDYVGRAGIDHVAFDHPGDVGLSPIWAALRAVPEAEREAFIVREIFAGLVAATALPGMREIVRAFRPQLVIRESVEFAGAVAAGAARIPCARVAVHSGAAERPFRTVGAAAVDRLRASAGLPADGGAWLSAEPVFTWFPPALDGQDGDGAGDGNGDGAGGPSTLRRPFHVRTVLEATPGAAVPTWAAQDDPRPLVYVTFGTIAHNVAEARSVYRMALDALADLPVRALLTTGQPMNAEALGPVPVNVHVEAWAAHAEVFARAAAVVCHGGSGTVIAALASGLPLVVVPLFADQPHNARRVAALGAGLDLPAPTAETLRAAIQRSLDDTGLRRAAGRVAAEIAALPTVDAAVDAMAALATLPS